MKKLISLVLACLLTLSLCAFADVEIEVFTRKSEIVDQFNEVLAKYNEAHPGVVAVQNQVPDAATVLYSRLASDDMPEVVGIYPNEAEFVMQAQSGYYMDLTGAACLTTIPKHFLDGVAVDGKYYSVPMTFNGWGIHYNIDKFAELGLAVPATWDELKDVCEKIKAAGYIPFATSLTEGWTIGHLAEGIILNIAGAEGAKNFFADTAVKAQDSEPLQEMLDWLDFFKANSQEDAIGTSSNNAIAMFAAGQALMLPQGIWSNPSIKAAGMTDQVGMFPMPNADGKGMILYGVDMAFAVAANAENADAVLDFMSFLTSTETAQMIYDFEASPSSVTGVVGSNPEVAGVTDLLFEEGRNEPWLHFNWAAGVDGNWQAELSSYMVLEDRDSFNENINELFGK